MSGNPAVRVRAVLQARTSSSRLPAKALLTLRGYPTAVLAGLRVRDLGDVVVAVPDGAQDDALARVLGEAGLSVVRGPEADVRERFLIATQDLADDDIVVRLTADNVVPDADFVRELVAAFVAGDAPYLGTSSPYDDLPYGLHAEAFRAGALRQAARAESTPADREHVTGALRRRHGAKLFRPDRAPTGLGRLRCTLDTLTDYQRLLTLFSDDVDPLTVGWLELCQRLAQLPGAAAFRIPFRDVEGEPHGTLVLGTAQLGMTYGRMNRTGQPDSDVARAMIRYAVDHGVSHVDTARAYGASESVIGEARADGLPGHVRVVTKLDPLKSLAPDASEEACRQAVESSVFRSARELRTRTLDVLLLHRAHHHSSHGGAVWSALKDLVAAGWITRLGVSVQTPAELEGVLRDPAVRLIQLPFNLLDTRWRQPEVLAAIGARPDVVFHLRSSLLQGVIVATDPAAWPVVEGVDARALVASLAELVRTLGRADVMDLAFAYCRGQSWATAVVVGADNPAQLAHDLELFRAPALTPAECAIVEKVLPAHLPEAFLNPAAWS